MLPKDLLADLEVMDEKRMMSHMGFEGMYLGESDLTIQMRRQNDLTAMQNQFGQQQAQNLQQSHFTSAYMRTDIRRTW